MLPTMVIQEPRCDYWPRGERLLAIRQVPSGYYVRPLTGATPPRCRTWPSNGSGPATRPARNGYGGSA